MFASSRERCRALGRRLTPSQPSTFPRSCELANHSSSLDSVAAFYKQARIGERSLGGSVRQTPGSPSDRAGCSSSPNLPLPRRGSAAHQLFRVSKRWVGPPRGAGIPLHWRRQQSLSGTRRTACWGGRPVLVIVSGPRRRSKPGCGIIIIIFWWVLYVLESLPQSSADQRFELLVPISQW